MYNRKNVKAVLLGLALLFEGLNALPSLTPVQYCIQQRNGSLVPWTFYQDLSDGYLYLNLVAQVRYSSSDAFRGSELRVEANLSKYLGLPTLVPSYPFPVCCVPAGAHSVPGHLGRHQRD